MENHVLIQNITLPELQKMLQDTLEECLQKRVTMDTGAPEILTRTEAAKMLHVSLPTLHYWTKEGIVKGTRIGTRVRYRLADVEAALVNIVNIKHARS